MVHKSRIWSIGLFALTTAGHSLPTCAQPEGQAQDSQIKAAYIMNIALFTTWPATSAQAKTLTVCANPHHSLWNSLREMDGRNVNGRAWSTVDVTVGKDCDIVVMSVASAPHNLPQAHWATLYVVDGREEGKYLGAVSLVEEDQHIRFDVDTKEAARVGLRFSSRLLRLARNVV